MINQNKLSLTTSIIFIGITLIIGNAQAESGRKTYPIAIMDQSPYGFRGKNGASKGYLFDIGKAILKKAGLDSDVKLQPMKRLFEYMSEGIVDCTLLATTPFTRAHYRLIETTGLMLKPAIIPKTGINLSQYKDLQGLAIGVPRGVRFDDQFDQDKSLNKITTKNYPLSVLMLERGRFDAIVGVLGSYLFNARELGFQPEQIFGKPLIFKTIPIWLVCRHGGPSQQIEEKLKLATSELRSDGSISNIMEKYLGQKQKVD